MTKLKAPKIINEQKQTITQHDVFAIVEKEKTFIAIGNTIISEKTFKNTEEAISYINSKPYELIINTCCYIMQLNNEKKNETK